MHSFFSFITTQLSHIGPSASSQQITLDFPIFVWWFSCIPIVGLIYGLFQVKKRNHREFLFLSLFFFIFSFPLFGMCLVPDAIVGAYPTIDKQGSLFFYQQGVHVKSIVAPIASMQEQGVQLIGFHMGHHWITASFDLFFSLSTAYNLHILFNFYLSTVSMWMLLWLQDSQEKKIWLRIGVSLLFGCGIHSYVDAHWYTIEKSALYTLPLLIICIQYIKKPFWTGIALFITAYINLYFGILSGMLFLIYILFHRSQWRQGIGILFTGIIVLLYQRTLMQYTPTIATPEMYIEQRARFDALHLFSFDWARIPLYLVINPVVLWLAYKSTKKHIWEKITFSLFFLLSIGPYLYHDFTNPIYWLFHKIPFMWRFSEPEIFFHICLMILYIWTLKSEFSKNLILFFYVYVIFQLSCVRLPLSQFF